MLTSLWCAERNGPRVTGHDQMTYTGMRRFVAYEWSPLGEQLGSPSACSIKLHAEGK
jgi:hypothetical protein